MKAQDLTFLEIEGEPPPFWRCHCCGEQGVTLAAVVPLPDQSSDTVIVGMCSPACASVFKRRPDADAMIATMLAKAEAEKARITETWPEEMDV